MKNGKRVLIGIFFGAIAGAVDTVIAVLQKAPLSAAISAFSYWTIAGFIISAIDLNLKGGLKGLFVSLLLLIPVGVPIVWQNHSALLPMVIFTAIMGYILGYLIERAG